MSSINVKTTRHGDRLRFEVSGDLDYLNDAAVVTAALEGMHDPGVTAIDLDLSQLGFCDSTGLGALITIHSHAVDRGLPLVLCGPRVGLLRLLTLTGVDTLFTILLDAPASADVEPTA
ncbi:MAG TPA: STAS domain-containing protein [Jatrophihabitans sp.]|jgi:anti-sigma B factor antagonist|uniref:STAS domain-containing protein n=1 Tax=Jatrophihabitans sp. TaxID=1932789 RepID=UPI002E0489D7|nr:STAS domain-containing protein [Jatrophihabitans sp.]